MTEERICPIHKVPFKRFEKGGSIWYSHKDGDKWCNKPKAEELTIAPGTASSLQERIDKQEKESGAMSKNDWAEKDRVTRKSIERQTALNNAVELAKIQSASQRTSEQVVVTAQLFEEYLESGLFKSVRPTPIKEVEQAPARRTETMAGEPDLVPKSLGQLYTWINRHKIDKGVTARDFVLKYVKEEQLSDVLAVYKIVKEKNKGWKDYPN